MQEPPKKRHLHQLLSKQCFVEHDSQQQAQAPTQVAEGVGVRLRLRRLLLTLLLVPPASGSSGGCRVVLQAV